MIIPFADQIQRTPFSKGRFLYIILADHPVTIGVKSRPAKLLDKMRESLRKIDEYFLRVGGNCHLPIILLGRANKTHLNDTASIFRRQRA